MRIHKPARVDWSVSSFLAARLTQSKLKEERVFPAAFISSLKQAGSWQLKQRETLSQQDVAFSMKSSQASGHRCLVQQRAAVSPS